MKSSFCVFFSLGGAEVQTYDTDEKLLIIFEYGATVLESGPVTSKGQGDFMRGSVMFRKSPPD
jgi:hypothetical protein